MDKNEKRAFEPLKSKDAIAFNAAIIYRRNAFVKTFLQLFLQNLQKVRLFLPFSLDNAGFWLYNDAKMSKGVHFFAGSILARK